MNLQRLVEQYISFQRSLGSVFISEAVVLRASSARVAREPAFSAFAFSTWRRFWAKSGQ